MWQGNFFVLPEGVDGSPGAVAQLRASGKNRIPTRENPDRQVPHRGTHPRPRSTAADHCVTCSLNCLCSVPWKDWNYGVRCYHGSASTEKTEDCYQPKKESSLPVFRLPFDPQKPRVLSSGPLGHREAGDGEYAWDYGMPIGSEVLATMGGEVLRYASHFLEGR